MRIPMINAREWRAIEPLLPPTGGPGKPRLDDRLMLSGFYYAAACSCTFDSLPKGYGNAQSLRSRRRRWSADGTFDSLMQAGAPVIARMKANYWGLLAAASDIDSSDWRSSSEFFGRGVIPKLPHAQPKGRYADRRR
jgi:hypothetical protein